MCYVNSYLNSFFKHFLLLSQITKKQIDVFDCFSTVGGELLFFVVLRCNVKLRVISKMYVEK